MGKEGNGLVYASDYVQKYCGWTLDVQFLDGIRKDALLRTKNVDDVSLELIENILLVVAERGQGGATA